MEMDVNKFFPHLLENSMHAINPMSLNNAGNDCLGSGNNIYGNIPMGNPMQTGFIGIPVCFEYSVLFYLLLFAEDGISRSLPNVVFLLLIIFCLILANEQCPCQLQINSVGCFVCSCSTGNHTYIFPTFFIQKLIFAIKFKLFLCFIFTLKILFFRISKN